MAEHAHKEHEHKEHHEHAPHEHPAKGSKYSGAVNVLLIAVFLLVAYNQYLISSISLGSASGLAVLSSSNLASAGSGASASQAGAVATSGAASSAGSGKSSPSGAAASTGDEVQDAINAVIPTGTPAVYGPEIGVSFDKPIESIKILSNFDKSTTFSGDQLQRYVNIASRTACEYCCGAKTLVFKDGRAACGCEHSYAMRGVIKYLIQKHGSEYTDDQILEQANKWKALFFPKQSVQKYLQSKGGSVDTSALPSQVGGC